MVGNPLNSVLILNSPFGKRDRDKKMGRPHKDKRRMNKTH